MELNTLLEFLDHKHNNVRKEINKSLKNIDFVIRNSKSFPYLSKEYMENLISGFNDLAASMGEISRKIDGLDGSLLDLRTELKQRFPNEIGEKIEYFPPPNFDD